MQALELGPLRVGVVINKLLKLAVLCLFEFVLEYASLHVTFFTSHRQLNPILCCFVLFFVLFFRILLNDLTTEMKACTYVWTSPFFGSAHLGIYTKTYCSGTSGGIEMCG